MSTEYYVVSLMHTQRIHRVITLWGPNDSGYYFRLERAGRYTEARIRELPSYYNDGERNIAVECSIIEGKVSTVAEVESLHLDRHVSPTDRVIMYRHMPALKARRLKP